MSDPFAWQQPPITPATAEDGIEAQDWVEQDLLTRGLAARRLEAVAARAAAELEYLQERGAPEEQLAEVRRRIDAAARSRSFLEEGRP